MTCRTAWHQKPEDHNKILTVGTNMCLLLYLQKFTIGPYPEPVQSILYNHISLKSVSKLYSHLYVAISMTCN